VCASRSHPLLAGRRGTCEDEGGAEEPGRGRLELERWDEVVGEDPGGDDGERGREPLGKGGECVI